MEHRNIFEKALTWAIHGDPEKAEAMSNLDDSQMFHLLVRVVSDNLTTDGPHWYFNNPFFGPDENKGRWVFIFG